MRALAAALALSLVAGCTEERRHCELRRDGDYTRANLYDGVTLIKSKRFKDREDARNYCDRKMGRK